MGCQTRIALVMFAAAAWAACQAPGAEAHQSFVTGDTLFASKGMLELGASGKLGFKRSSPWYFFGEALKSGVPGSPRDDAFRYGAEIGYEGRRFGFVGHWDHLINSAYGLNMMRAGGGVRVRFLTWEKLSSDEEINLSRADKEALREKRQREMLSQVPNALMLLFDVDVIMLSTPFGDDGGMEGNRLQAQLRWKVKPWWYLWPSIEAYVYPHDPGIDIGANTAYASRNLRLVRIGQFGAYSGAFGLAKGSQQLLSQFNFSSTYSSTVALTRINMGSNPTSTVYSLYLGLNRRLGRDESWILTPVYEHVKYGADTFGFMSIRLSYEFNGPFIPL